MAETNEQKELIKHLCLDVAYVATREDGHPNVSESDTKVEQYLKMNIPQCLAIKTDYTEKNRFLAALNSGDWATMEGMLKSGFDPNSRYENYSTPLIIATRKADYQTVELLLRYKADSNLIDHDFRPAIYRAVFSENAKLVALLIKGGADPNLRDTWGSTPFLDAVERGKTVAVVEMIKAGANVNDTRIASLSGSWPLGYGSAAIHLAKRTEIIAALLDAGVDVNVRTKHGETPLMAAAWHGNITAVRLLLSRGADVNARNQNGSTALFAAVRGSLWSDEARYAIVVQELLDAGAELDARELRPDTLVPNVLSVFDLARKEGLIQSLLLKAKEARKRD